MFLFCVSTICVICVANFVNVPVVVCFQRENSVGAVYEKVLSKVTIFCLDCVATQKTAPKQKFWCSIGSLLRRLVAFFQFRGDEFVALAVDVDDLHIGIAREVFTKFGDVNVH